MDQDFSMQKSFMKTIKQWIEYHKAIYLNDFNEYEPSLGEMSYLMNQLMKHQVKLLYISKIKLTEETGKYFGEQLSKIQLKAFGITIENESDWKILSKLVNMKLHHLDLSYSTIHRNGLLQIIRLLSVNNHIRNLTLSNCNIDDAQFNFLITKLKTLNITINLDGNKITDYGAVLISEILSDVYINSIKFYQDLDLDSCEVKGIVKNPYTINSKSFSLDLSGNRLSTSGKFHIIKSLSNRQKILLKINYKSNKPLSTNKCLLEVINLLRASELSPVNIYKIKLNANDFNNTINALKFIKITDLSLRTDTLSPDTIPYLQMDELLNSTLNMQIESLKLNNFTINAHEAEAIVYYLENMRITHLKLYSNVFDKNGFVSIIDSISTSNLTELSLNKVGIDDDLCVLLAESVGCSKIIKLDLSYNGINSKGAKAIAENLPQMQLVTLNLSKNPINSSAIVFVIKAVVMHRRICEFYISICCFECIDQLLPNIQIVLFFNFLLVAFPIASCNHILLRNRNLLNRAINVIYKFKNNQLKYNLSDRADLIAFQSVINSYYLWKDINNPENIKHAILNKINENYLKITGVVNRAVTCANYHPMVSNIAKLPADLIAHICSYLKLTYVRHC